MFGSAGTAQLRYVDAPSNPLLSVGPEVVERLIPKRVLWCSGPCAAIYHDAFETSVFRGLPPPSYPPAFPSFTPSPPLSVPLLFSVSAGQDGRAPQELRLLRQAQASVRRKEPVLAVLSPTQAMHPQREEEERSCQGDQVRAASKTVDNRGVGGSCHTRNEGAGLAP